MAATNYHERHQELATAVDIPDEQKEANKSLINVSYMSQHDSRHEQAVGRHRRVAVEAHKTETLLHKTEALSSASPS